MTSCTTASRTPRTWLTRANRSASGTIGAPSADPGDELVREDPDHQLLAAGEHLGDDVQVPDVEQVEVAG